MGEVWTHTGRMVTDSSPNPPLARRAISPPTPEAGAVCGNSACTDLHGGCLVRGIPTVTVEDRVRFGDWDVAKRITRLKTRLSIEDPVDHEVYRGKSNENIIYQIFFFERLLRLIRIRDYRWRRPIVQRG